MEILKQVWKYLLITISALLVLVAVYMTFQLDMLVKSGDGVSTDGFGNVQNPENGKAYWTGKYLLQRATQTVFFFGGISLIGYAYNLKTSKSNES